jgi:hypothetical protein
VEAQTTMKVAIMKNTQLEMGLETSALQPCHRRIRPQRRNRAKWWFTQMRLLVNSATDWTPAPPARPEQIHLVLTRKDRTQNW